MNKKVLTIICAAVIALSITGCQQGMTKSLGGNMVLNLEPNTKLEEITWKDDNLWYLTKPMLEDDFAETHTFQQKSEFGIFEGTVTIIEKRAQPEQAEEYSNWKTKAFMTYDDYLIYKENGYSLDDILAGNVDYSIFNGN